MLYLILNKIFVLFVKIFCFIRKIWYKVEISMIGYLPRDGVIPVK